MSQMNPEKFLSLAEWLGEEFIFRLDEGHEAVRQAVAQEFGITTVDSAKDNAYERTIAEQQRLQAERDALARAETVVNSFVASENLESEFNHLDAIERDLKGETDLDQARIIAQINRIHDTNPPQVNTPTN